MTNQISVTDPNIVLIPIQLLFNRELLFNRKVGDGAKALFGLLKYRQGTEANVMLSKQMMATDLHVAIPTINRRLRELQLAGYLIIYPRSGYANVYEVVDFPTNQQAGRGKQFETVETKAHKRDGTYIQKFGEALRQRDGNACAYCEIDLLTYAEVYERMQEPDTELRQEIFGMMATVDHVIPRSNGGSDDLNNLALCCMKCNVEKGAK